MNTTISFFCNMAAVHFRLKTFKQSLLKFNGEVFLFLNNPVADSGYLGVPPITELNNVTAL